MQCYRFEFHSFIRIIRKTKKDRQSLGTLEIIKHFVTKPVTRRLTLADKDRIRWKIRINIEQSVKWFIIE